MPSLFIALESAGPLLSAAPAAAYPQAAASVHPQAAASVHSQAAAAAASLHPQAAGAAASLHPQAAGAAASLHPQAAGAAASLHPQAAGAAASLHPQAAATLSPAMQKALQTYGQEIPKSPFAAHFPWLAHTFAALFLFSSIALILLLAIQTTKQEGLSGSVGGKVEASYRARPGVEQQLARLTSLMAILFVLSATLVSLSGF